MSGCVCNQLCPCHAPMQKQRRVLGFCRLCGRHRVAVHFRALERPLSIGTSVTARYVAQATWVCLSCCPPELEVAPIPAAMEHLVHSERGQKILEAVRRWQGVPPPRCQDCTVRLGKRSTRRCWRCYLRSVGSRKPHCLDCKRPLSKSRYVRCQEHALRFRRAQMWASA